MVFLLILISLNCFSSEFFSPKASNATLAENILRYQCGACHIGSLETANPKALKIFDFQDQNWASKLTQSQKKEMLSRLEQRVDMTDLEVSYLMPRGWSPLPTRPSRNKVEEVKKFLKDQ